MATPFTDRGGGWVAGQTVLMTVAVARVPLCLVAWGGVGVRDAVWILCGASAITLGRNRTIFPRPQ